MEDELLGIELDEETAELKFSTELELGMEDELLGIELEDEATVELELP